MSSGIYFRSKRAKQNMSLAQKKYGHKNKTQEQMKEFLQEGSLKNFLKEGKENNYYEQEE